jgi:hypothetical protein
MVDFIQSEFKKIILKCCANYQKDVALILGMDENGNNTYTIIEYLYDNEKDEFLGFDFNSQKHISILDVLGVRIDILGYSNLSQPFIQKSLLRFSEKCGVRHDKISMFCMPTQTPKLRNGEVVYDRDGNVTLLPDVSIYLYNGRDENMSIYLETITFSDLFSEQDIEIPK